LFLLLLIQMSGSAIFVFFNADFLSVLSRDNMFNVL